MNNFSEFERPLAPQKEAGSIITHAWENYKGIFGYGVGFIIIYYVLYLIITGILSFFIPGSEEYKSQIMDVIENFSKNGKFDYNALKELQDQVENAKSFTASILEILVSGIAGAILTPLVAGLIYIVHKANRKMSIGFGDLFIGYKQSTTNLIVFGFFYAIFFTIGWHLYKLPAIYIAIICFITLPIIFFENKNPLEAVRQSLTIAHANFINILSIWLIAGIIGISGGLLCCIGIIFTFPFFYSAQYSTYCAYCGTPYEINKN